MFCSCPNMTTFGEPNVYICPVCLGHPGTLPAMNKKAVLLVLRAGKSLNCSLRDVSRFDRKNYFYPDLPKGYQISQDRRPLCFNGFLNIEEKRIRIKRIHLEEDAGRLMHDKKIGCSLVDFNRAGVPLMELVTEPDIRSGREARKFAEELRIILQYLDLSDANMEQGQMRVEVNISVSHMEGRLGTKVEIKNLNSFRAVSEAIDYEIKRQKNVLEKGEQILQETRGWDEEKGETFSQREKEGASDYRYFPEPDLPPLYLDEPPFSKKKILVSVELPQNKRARFRREYGIEDKHEIETLIASRSLADFFEKVISEAVNWIKESQGKEKVEKQEKRELVKIAKSYLLSDFLGLLKNGLVEESRITAENFSELIVLVYNSNISSKIAKALLKEMHERGGDPSQIIEEQGLSAIKDEEKIKDIVAQVLGEQEAAVGDYQSGKEQALQFLIGCVMAKTRGRVAPEDVKKILLELLGN